MAIITQSYIIIKQFKALYIFIQKHDRNKLNLCTLLETSNLLFSLNSKDDN